MIKEPTAIAIIRDDRYLRELNREYTEAHRRHEKAIEDLKQQARKVSEAGVAVQDAIMANVHEHLVSVGRLPKGLDPSEVKLTFSAGAVVATPRVSHEKEDCDCAVCKLKKLLDEALGE